jgi:hypothetical protein
MAGLLRRGRAAAAALSQLAGTRAAPCMLSRSPGTDLTSSDPPGKGPQGPLKFLALRGHDVDGASMSLPEAGACDGRDLWCGRGFWGGNPAQGCQLPPEPAPAAFTGNALAGLLSNAIR